MATPTRFRHLRRCELDHIFYFRCRLPWPIARPGLGFESRVHMGGSQNHGPRTCFFFWLSLCQAKGVLFDSQMFMWFGLVAWGFEPLALALGKWKTTPEPPNHQSKQPTRGHHRAVLFADVMDRFRSSRPKRRTRSQSRARETTWTPVLGRKTC